jgi:hypothetical protein
MPMTRPEPKGVRGFFETTVEQVGRKQESYSVQNEGKWGCTDRFDQGQEMVLEVTIRPSSEHPLESSYQEILEALRKLGFSDG